MNSFVLCVSCFEGPVLIYPSNLIRYHSESKQKSPSPRDPLCDRRETKAPLISTIASGTISIVIFHSRHTYIFVFSTYVLHKGLEFNAGL